MNRMLIAAAGLSGLLAGAAHAELRIDGRIEPDEWQRAEHIADFKLTQPLTGAASPYPTEAWVLATPEGLAIGFRNVQPATVPRTRQRTQRDQDAPVDRVNLMVDFNGDGGTGYNFTLNLTDGIIDAVISNENDFSKDWDGIWQHAVSESGDTWSAEMLIPWHIAPMKKGDAEGYRSLGIYLDRVIGSTGERVAWPAASYTRPRFLSEFNRMRMPAYSQSLLAVTPYVVSITDRVEGDTRFDTGADLFWKPSGSFQLTATLNPDFGQVESDQLVVNFDAVETFFSDKRPFFTENQSLFDLPFGLNNSRLLYTRRVGGPTDDGSGSGDVRAAVKLNGNAGATDYGLLAATEADAVGRDFYALRLAHDRERQDIGVMLTHVHRPYLDRDANVLAFDHHWKPTPRWNIITQWTASDVTENGERIRDDGMQLIVNNERERGWRQSLYFVHLGDRLQLNDFGYLSRNNLNFLNYTIKHRVTDLPESSMYRSQDWGYVASLRYNDDGRRLLGIVQLNRYSETRTGGSEYFEVSRTTPGYDDLITRGHGDVRLPARLSAYYERNWPRRGRWSRYGSAGLRQSGLEGIGSSALELYFKPTFHINDDLSIYAGLGATHTPDWLLWREDNLLGTYRGRHANIAAGMQWSIGSRQELRLKIEAIAIDAKLKQAWRVATDGTPMPVNEPVPDFKLNNFGVQLRYRYELAPLSDLFVVYGRGGYGFEQQAADSIAGLLGDAFSLRDDEQFLIKLSYRFAK